MIYTGLSYSDIFKLTLIQYNDLLASIMSKQMWDLQSYTVALSGEFDEEINPLFGLNTEEKSDKKMKMEDVQELMSMLK